MSSEEPEKLEAGDAGGEEAKKIARAAVESAEAEKVLTERRIDEAIFDHLKSNKDVRVVDLSKKLGTVDKAVIAARLEKLVEEGDLGAGNTSSAPNFKRYPPDGKKKKIIEFVGDEPKDEKTVKDFVKTLDLPNKEARRDFLANLVTKKILNFENGKYSKFQAPKNDAENSDVAAQPAVEISKDSSPTVLDEKTIEHLRPVVGKIQDIRSAMIQMMNQVEGGRRVATKEERDAFYGNLRIFLETARSAENSGLRLSAQGEEQKKFLEGVDTLEEQRVDDEDSFRRAVIGIGNELAIKLKSQERRAERERAAAAPEPLPDLQTPTPEIAKKLSPEEIRARGKNLEQAREAMVQMMATINHPTAEQQKELREKLGIFLKSTNELQESGLLLSAEALKDKTLLERSVINKIFNPRKFRTALQRIDDEFLAQAPVAEKENKKSNEVIERPLISSEKFSDDKYHRFGDFEKKQFVGVYMGHDGDNQDAFAVNEKSVAVGDGMGSYPLSGLLSRHVVERMAARVKKQASYEEFQKLFEDGSLGALLTVIKDDKRYQQARQDFIARWNPDEHDGFSFEDFIKKERNGIEASTTFSIIRESDDGAEMQYADLGDSPVIVVDRDETGAVTDWQLLNEKGVIIDLEGKSTQVDITDKTAYYPSIVSELRSNFSDGISLTADGIAMYGDKAITGRIPKKENRLVIVASDGLTKLLTKSPMALENQAVFCDTLLNFSDEQFAQYVKDTKDARFPLAVSADGTPNPDEIKRAKAIIKADYTTLFDQAYAVQKTYPQLWNIDGSLNMLAVLSADPKTLEFAGDDLTYIVAAAGEQKVSLPLQAVVQPKTVTEEPVEAPDAIKPTVVSRAEIESMPVRKYTDADYTEEEIKKGKEFVDSILERSEAKVPERLLTKDQLEEPMMLRARALMVLEIVNMLPGENPALREQIAEALVSRVAREIVEGYDKNSYIPGDQLRNLLPLLRERLVNDQDLLNDLGPKLQTWRQLAQRLSSGMNEVGAAMYKAWVAQYPERKNQFFDYERNTLYDLVLAADQWIADLKNNTTLDSNLKRLLLVNLEQAKRNAEQKFEIWGKEKLERITKVEESEVEIKPETLTDEQEDKDGVIDLSKLSDKSSEELVDGLLFDEGDDLDLGPASAPAVPPSSVPSKNLAMPAMPGAVPPKPLGTPPPAPKTPAKKKPATSAKPLDIKFEGGRFNVSMAEAFRNDVFYNFFQKFDNARNSGAKFDATMPGHDERYEKGLEAYMLWREAIQVFKLHAAERLERDLGLKPYPEDLASIESDLERLIIVDTQQVRGLIDQINAYAGMEEDEARKENELIDLGGFAKVQSQVDELDVLRREKKARANEYIAALSVLSRQRADAARAFEVKKRTWFQWPKAPKKEKAGDQAIRVISGVGDNVNRATSSFFGSIMDRLRGAIAPTRSSEASRSVRSLSAPESVSQLEATGRALDKFITAVEDEKRTSFFGSMVNSAKERFRGLLRGKEAVDLERKLQSTYGMSVDEAADSYPEMYKRERAFELQTEAAIREYEKIEQRYFEVKDQILASKLPRVTQEKEQISTQFDQLRRAIIADTGIATTVAKLTAGRSIDIIKGLMDPESITPNRAKKAEDQLVGLRRAADFDFTEGRYAGVPELAPLVGEGELIAEADTVINEGVKGELKDAVAKFKKIDKKGIESISKTFASYGQRGYELGEQVLGEAIETARAANDDRRANIFQVLLLEIRALKS